MEKISSVPQPKLDMEYIEKRLTTFHFPNDTLREMSRRLNDEMNKAAQSNEGAQNTVKMLPTFVRHLPDQTETGNYLALDLGGTKFRVLLITLNGINFQMTSDVFEIPQSIMIGPGKDTRARYALRRSKDKGRAIRRSSAFDDLALLTDVFKFPIRCYYIQFAAESCSEEKYREVLKSFAEYSNQNSTRSTPSSRKIPSARALTRVVIKEKIEVLPLASDQKFEIFRNGDTDTPNTLPVVSTLDTSDYQNSLLQKQEIFVWDEVESIFSSSVKTSQTANESGMVADSGKTSIHDNVESAHLANIDAHKCSCCCHNAPEISSIEEMTLESCFSSGETSSAVHQMSHSHWRTRLLGAGNNGLSSTLIYINHDEKYQ
uniref:Phosphotransferase n=1 Tax=Romanomermis culicivorax TaxID=13658 RepID=A0A915KGH6_ROMCU